MNKFEEVSVVNIKGGEAVQKIDFEISRAIANCIDLNTDPKAKRTVTLKLTFVPSPDRSGATVMAQASSKLCPDVAAVEHVIISQNGQGLVNTAKQTDIHELIDNNGVVHHIARGLEE